MQTAIDILDGLSSSTATKGPCACATTVNIALSGEKTIDGVVTAESRVLVKNQTDTTMNGVYRSSTGDWTRTADFSRNDDVIDGTLVVVAGGSTQIGLWQTDITGAMNFGVSTIAFLNVLVLTGSIPLSYLDTDGALTANSDVKIATQKAVKTFVTAAIAALAAATSAAISAAIAALTLGTASTKNTATAAEVWAGTATTLISPATMQAALAEQNVADGATLTINLSLGINFNINPTIGGNRALAFTVAAGQVGRSGYIRCKQDATGSRTLDTATDTKIINANGQDIVLSTAANAIDLLYYQAISTTEVMLSLARAVAH